MVGGYYALAVPSRVVCIKVPSQDGIGFNYIQLFYILSRMDPITLSNCIIDIDHSNLLLALSEYIKDLDVPSAMFFKVLPLLYFLFCVFLNS
jgi:hypothetical protein